MEKNPQNVLFNTMVTALKDNGDQIPAEWEKPGRREDGNKERRILEELVENQAGRET